MKTSTKLYLRIGFLCLIAVLDGMVDSCMGRALRDLQCIFNVTLQKVSLFQPAITASRVIGALLFLKIPGRVDIYGVAAATMTMASCLLAVVPVLPSFWMALGLSGAVGLAHGASVHARIILSGELSKQHPATIHIINLATSAGSVTGPLIISPFLSDSVAQSNTRQAFHHDNMTFMAQNRTDPAFHHGNMTFIAQNRTDAAFHHGNMTCIAQNRTDPSFHHGNMTFIAQNRTDAAFHHGNMTCIAHNRTDAAFHHGNMTCIAHNRTHPAFHHGNMTFIAQNRTDPAFHHGNMTFIAQNITTQLRDRICYSFNSDLMYGFLIMALLGVVLFSAYLLTQRVFQDDTYVNQPKEMPVIAISLIDGIFLIIFTMYTVICGPMIFVYGHFLPTFGIHCKLHADTRQLTNMSLSLYVCVMFGRLFGTLSSLAVEQTVLINACAAVGIMVSAMLVYVSELDTIWLWIGTSILAGVTSPVISALNTWVLEVNRHRPILYGISSIGDMAGYSVMSLLTGQLMANISVQMLHYVMATVLLLQMVLIMFLYLTVHVGKRVNSGNEDYMYIE